MSEEAKPDKQDRREPIEVAREPFEFVPHWSEQLDEYPLRKPEEDPRWARIVVSVWVVIVVFMLAFMGVLTFLGWFYD